ncbi:hypothetical protein DTO063F5_2347 [Paecilomyces variotii]|nr:hypothetical protein DTO063F5_2347 [Paecilomyces variotii]
MPATSKRQATASSHSSKEAPTPDARMSLKSMLKPAPPSESNKSSLSPASSTSMPTTTTSDLADQDAPAMKANNEDQTTENAVRSVNKKKQKRRQKEAARRAAEQQLNNGYAKADQNGHEISDETSSRHTAHYPHNVLREVDDGGHYEPAHGEVYFYEDENGVVHQQGHESHDEDEADQTRASTSKKSKKKKGKKGRSDSHNLVEESSTSLSATSRGPPSSISNAALRSAQKVSKDRIWNTSTQEERENIKTFWLELGEEERRQLVKVEKDAVLKKMKEQQKHSCSCTVCGRKRTAIEEELEVLYDAYYEELEQYANNNQGSFENGAPIVPPPRLYQPPLRSFDHHSHMTGHHHPSRGRVHELPDDDEELEEEYDEDDEDDDEPYSDEELEDEATRSARADFFAFGNSLTVKDGILTVADDLLKNDGKHFIDMMEQLAERRMQREEDTQYRLASAHQSLHAGHNHGPLDEEDYDDEEDEEYDSQDEEEYEDDEMDAMTEEQRMEEGRRMFQIFAARMFEQRVLTAYREKVAEQRQQKLLQELMEEQTLTEQRNAKKAREAQKKKDKKRQQKLAKEEERARREAERAAEEAAARALEEKKQEEQRRKREEQRKKKEAEKKAQEEERLRKEAEKQKRLQEERERQAEAERKQREQKERERKKREEAKRKEREEREARERKTREERERKAREEQAKKDKETASKAEMEARERAKREGQPGQQTQASAKRTSQSGPIPIPPGLQHPQGLHSPHFQIATPVVPKAPTPMRARQPSQQGSHTSSPRSQPAGTELSQTPVSPHTAPSVTSSAASFKGSGPQPVLHHPQPSAPLSPLGAAGRGPPLGFPGVNGLPSNPPGLAPRPFMGHDIPMYPPSSGPMGGQFRGFPAPNGITVPPGVNGSRPVPPGRGFPLDPGHGLPFYGQQPIGGSLPTQGIRSQAHSRQTSGSFDRPSLDSQTQTQPISRPSAIKRPSSTSPHDQQKEGAPPSHSDIDDLSAHLGSSALLNDSDAPFTSNLSQSLPGVSAIPGPFQGPARASFGGSPFFADPLSAPKHPSLPGSSSTWAPQLPFGTAFPGAQSWGAGPGSGWTSNAFGIGGHHRAHTSRPVTIRLLVIQACKQLNTLSPTSKGTAGFHHVNRILTQVDQLRPPNEPPISLAEMLDICDTEGNHQNGGGTFIIKDEGENGKSVKFEPDNNSSLPGHRGSIVPGDIGSPVPSHSLPAFGGIGTAGRQFSSPTAGF